MRIEMDDLAILGVNPSDRRRLESMGFTTLEQIAQMDPSQLALGKKGESLIDRARTILANKNIKDIKVDPDEIRVILDEKNDAIILATKDILEIFDTEEFLDIEPVVEGIRIFPKKYSTTLIQYDAEKREIEKRIALSQKAYKRVSNAANRHLTILKAKKKDVYTKFGITLEKQKIIDFAKERGFNGFWQNVFEEIRGNEIVKKALAISMFSSYDEPVHILVIGDPGSSKTLAKDIIANNFKGISLVGGNSTRSGLVCNLVSGALGVLAYSDQKLVLVDEFDKIPQADVEYCSELLSNGKASVHSAKVHEDIESHFILIAFANPKSKVFGPNPIAEIGISPILMSRFGMVVKTENLEKDDRMDLFKKKFYGKAEIKKVPELYDQWVKLARLHQPEINVSDKRLQSYLNHTDKIFENYSQTPLRRDLRMGDYIKRIPSAIARAQFSNITDNTLSLAEQILIESLKNWKI